VRGLKRFDVSLRSVYAQAKELALAQERVPLVTPGSLQVEARGGRRFVYHYRYDPAGRRVTEYLGPEDDEATVARVAEVGAAIAEAESLAGYSRDLRRLGFYAADNSTLVTVASLFNAGVFAGGGVLVGTHAYGVLLNELGVQAAPFPLTEDVDLARPGRIQLAGLPRGGLLALLRETGLPFHEVPQLRRHAPPTSFKVRGQKLKVDLLVPARGKPYESVAVPELGVHATGLPHFRYLLESPSPAVLLGRDRIVPVLVPHAGRFCLHKLAVYALRPDAAKRDNDVAQAALLAAALAAQDEFLLDEAADALDRALRKKLKPGARRALTLLGDDHPAAAERLGALVE
jgi:hypothetical protein